MGLLIFTFILALILVWAISQYNSLIALRNRVQAAWSDVEVYLKRRHDLIPNLVETVKGYMGHEKAVLENVTKWRASAAGAGGNLIKISESETGLTRALRELFAVAENYPNLKANQNFLELQKELAEIEQDIMQSRRYYNAVARDFNIKRETFPSNIVASIFGFKKAEYFELGAGENELPEVKF